MRFCQAQPDLRRRPIRLDAELPELLGKLVRALADLPGPPPHDDM